MFNSLPSLSITKSISLFEVGVFLAYEPNNINSKINYDEIILNDTQKITENASLKEYKCKTYTSNITQRVYRVDFTEK